MGLSTGWIWFGNSEVVSSGSGVQDDFSDDLYKELENYKTKYDLELDLGMPLEEPSVERATNETPEKPDAVVNPLEPDIGGKLSPILRGLLSNNLLDSFDNVITFATLDAVM